MSASNKGKNITPSLSASKSVPAPASHANGNNNNNNNEEDLSHHTILSIQSELHNMGKALTCPLCLSTLRQPSLLPCNHAFCHECIVTSFDPKHNRTIDKSSGKTSYKNKCPVCKVPCTKRSIVKAAAASTRLEDLVRGYKQALRSFGFVPVVYEPNVDIGMTQMEETVVFDSEDEDDDDDDDDDDEEEMGNVEPQRGKPRNNKTSAGGKKKDKAKTKAKKGPSLRQCHEHLEVSRGVHHVLKKATAALHIEESDDNSVEHDHDQEQESDASGTSHSPLSIGRSKSSSQSQSPETDSNSNPNPNYNSNTKDAKSKSSGRKRTRPKSIEEMERSNELKKLQHMINDQEKVVKVNERALVRAAVKKQKKRMSQGLSLGKATNNDNTDGTTTATKDDMATSSSKGDVKGQLSLGNQDQDQNHDGRKQPQKADVSSDAKTDTRSKGDNDDDETMNDTTSDVLNSNPNTNPNPHFPTMTASQHFMVARAMKAIEDCDGIMDDVKSPARQGSASQSQSQSQSQHFFSVSEYGSNSNANSFMDVSSPPLAMNVRPEMDLSDEEKEKEKEKDLHGKEHTKKKKNSATTSKASASANMNIMTSQELMDDAREKEIADRSGEWLEHEDEIEEKRRETLDGLNKKNCDGDGDGDDGSGNGACGKNSKTKKSRNAVRVMEKSATGSQEGQNTSQASMMSERFFSARSEPSQELIAPQPQPQPQLDQKSQRREEQEIEAAEEEQEDVVKEIFSKGDVVRVQDRTWPGVNKLGGVARISKVHTNSDAGVKYDVTYVLGGREKMVDAVFVQMHVDMESSSFTAAMNSPTATKEDECDGGDDSTAMSLGEKSSSTRTTRRSNVRKSRRVGEKNQLQEWIAQIDAEEMEQEKKRKRRTTRSSSSSVGTAKSDSGATAKKRAKTSRRSVSKEAKSVSEETKESAEDAGVGKSDITVVKTHERKARRVEKKPSEDDSDDETVMQEIEELPVKLSSMSFSDILDKALSRYASMIDQKKGVTKIETIYITSSGLDAKDKSAVKKFCTKCPFDGVKVKQLKDFNPYKTNILVTSVAEKAHSGEKMVKLRTMKAMRAALAGIPIVTSEWMSECLKHRQIISPDAEHCATALPPREESFTKNFKVTARNISTKKRDFSTAVYGVPTLAAFRSHLMFENCSVFLCGSNWKTNTTLTKDIQLLLREGGASMLTSASQATKFVKEEISVSIENATNPPVVAVLLCDDSESDADCGITQNLAKEVRRFFNHSEGSKKTHIRIVDSKWVFDSISCAEALDCNHYCPSSPLAASLWQYQRGQT